MARWREREAPAVPAWVLADITAPEVDDWLDDLYERDQDRWYKAFVEIISTPVHG